MQRWLEGELQPRTADDSAGNLWTSTQQIIQRRVAAHTVAVEKEGESGIVVVRFLNETVDAFKKRIIRRGMASVADGSAMAALIKGDYGIAGMIQIGGNMLITAGMFAHPMHDTDNALDLLSILGIGPPSIHASSIREAPS